MLIYKVVVIRTIATWVKVPKIALESKAEVSYLSLGNMIAFLPNRIFSNTILENVGDRIALRLKKNLLYKHPTKNLRPYLYRKL